MKFDWENTTAGRDAIAQSANAGARTAVVRLDGAQEAVHKIGGAEHGFTEALNRMATARSVGLAVGVLTVVNRSNARVMSEMPALLRARGAQAWRVVLPSYTEDDQLTGRAPRLVLALPPVLSALSRASKRGLAVELVDAPLCLLGPLRSLAVKTAPRSYGGPCQGCALRDACAGVDQVYLDRFGDRELRQVAEPG